MDIVRGMVVESSAGRDKGGFLVVVSFDGEHVLVCDGKRRPLERPKRKNSKHLKPMKTVLSEDSMATNREIRRSLRDLEEKNTK